MNLRPHRPPIVSSAIRQGVVKTSAAAVRIITETERHPQPSVLSRADELMEASHDITTGLETTTSTAERGRGTWYTRIGF
jgi:hypothetical protein